jgi:hypothetical protein
MQSRSKYEGSTARALSRSLRVQTFASLLSRIQISGFEKRGCPGRAYWYVYARAKNVPSA